MQLIPSRFKSSSPLSGKALKPERPYSPEANSWFPIPHNLFRLHIPPMEFFVLGVLLGQLHRAGGKVSTWFVTDYSEIGECTRMDRQAIKATLRALQGKGLIEMRGSWFDPYPLIRVAVENWEQPTLGIAG